MSMAVYMATVIRTLVVLHSSLGVAPHDWFMTENIAVKIKENNNRAKIDNINYT